jgi:hypothetical protein
MSRSAIAADTGNDVAAELQRRYEDHAQACSMGGDAHLPAALCSGILLRATARSSSYQVWNPNPGSSIKRAVSFSWLRKDAAFDGVVYNYTNGFIVTPYVEAESLGLTRLPVLCVYVFDADTFNRTGGANDGCAEHLAQPGTQPCQAQGIFTSTQWLARFRSASNRYTQQCAFIVEAGTPNADQIFMAVPEVRTALGTASVSLHDEVMIGVWAQNDLRLPIEAFFFRAGTTGVIEARSNQIDFEAATGRLVPVIEVTMPKTVNGAASFRYVP